MKFMELPALGSALGNRAAKVGWFKALSIHMAGADVAKQFDRLLELDDERAQARYFDDMGRTDPNSLKDIYKDPYGHATGKENPLMVATTTDYSKKAKARDPNKQWRTMTAGNSVLAGMMSGSSQGASAPLWDGSYGIGQTQKDLEDYRRGVVPGGDAAANAQRGFEQLQKEEIGKKMEQLADRTKSAGAAFGALSDGVAAAVNAAITGEQSIGKALMGAAASALRATAVQASVSALWETAKGFAALANPLTAATAGGYFRAAGAYAITAAAAGVASAGLSALGGGGGGGGHASAASGSGPGGHFVGGRNRGEGGDNITIHVHGYVGNEAEMAREIDKRLNQAKKTGHVRSGDGPSKFS